MWHGFIWLHDESTEAKALLSHTGAISPSCHVPHPPLVPCELLQAFLPSTPHEQASPGEPSPPRVASAPSSPFEVALPPSLFETILQTVAGA